MEDYELSFEDLIEAESPRRRIGKSKLTGVKLLEILLDEQGREIEKLRFGEDGHLRKKTLYLHDESRKPLLITSFDTTGKLIYRKERGKRPEIFE